MPKYVAYGPIRGWCRHRHDTAGEARLCCARDHAEARQVSRTAYSDRAVYELTPDGSIALSDGATVSLSA